MIRPRLTAYDGRLAEIRKFEGNPEALSLFHFLGFIFLLQIS